MHGSANEIYVLMIRLLGKITSCSRPSITGSKSSQMIAQSSTFQAQLRTAAQRHGPDPIHGTRDHSGIFQYALMIQDARCARRVMAECSGMAALIKTGELARFVTRDYLSYDDESTCRSTISRLNCTSNAL